MFLLLVTDASAFNTDNLGDQESERLIPAATSLHWKLSASGRFDRQTCAFPGWSLEHLSRDGLTCGDEAALLQPAAVPPSAAAGNLGQFSPSEF